MTLSNPNYGQRPMSKYGSNIVATFLILDYQDEILNFSGRKSNIIEALINLAKYQKS